MAKIFLFFAVILGYPTAANAAAPVQGPGFEIRQYLVGTIPEVIGRFALSKQVELDFGGGVDLIYHGDQGVQSRESGLGYGFSGGARLYLADPVFLGARIDVFRTSIDWADLSNPNLPLSGTSRFVVIQPTVEVGSNFGVGDAWLSPAIGFGAEFNTFVNGAPTGQGLILLVGISVIWNR